MEYSYSHVPNADEFGALGRREITAFQKWFLSTLDDRMNVLREQVRSFPGYETWQNDLTFDSLKRLSFWCYDRAAENIRIDENNVLDSFREWIAINVGVYVSLMLLRNVEGIDWFFNKTQKKNHYYGQPTIGPFGNGMYHNLLARVRVSLLKMIEGSQGKEGLIFCYNVCIESIDI